jgi:tRNA-2-methylthio-N6-dimethylallyladenosine synthase
MRWKDDIPLEVKQDRLQRLLDLQDRIGAEARSLMLGGTHEVLVERFNKDGKKLKGRTRCWKKVIFDGDESLIGTMQQVKVHSFSHETFIGDRLLPRESDRLKVI